MPIKVCLPELANGALHLSGELPAAELDLDDADELIHPRQPLEYAFTVEKGPDGLLVQGRLRVEMDGECARCLRPFPLRIEFPHWVCHILLSGEEKVPVSRDCVDLTPQIREDIVLAFPQHPLCRPDCQGLDPASSKGSAKPDSNGTKGGASTPWSELDKLKF